MYAVPLHDALHAAKNIILLPVELNSQPMQNKGLYKMHLHLSLYKMHQAPKQHFPDSNVQMAVFSPVKGFAQGLKMTVLPFPGR